MSDSMGLTDILKEIDEDADGETLQVKKVVEALEHRGYGPLLLAPALLTLLPTGGIPGVPTISAVLIFLVAVQILVAKKTPWLPQVLRERSVKKDKFEKTRKKAEPYTKKFDALLKPRLEALVSDVSIRIIAGLCMIIALSMPPLELVPFAAALPALAITLLAVGLSARDGLVILIGILTALLSITGAVYWLT